MVHLMAPIFLSLQSLAQRISFFLCFRFRVFGEGLSTGCALGRRGGLVVGLFFVVLDGGGVRVAMFDIDVTRVGVIASVSIRSVLG